MGTSWTLFCKRQLRYLGRNNLQGKYFHISNCIFTMKGWTVKKIILRCFFATGLFYLHEKFQHSQSSPSCILSKNYIFFIIFVGKIFFLQNVYGFTPVKFFLSDLGQNWAKTKQLLLKRFQLLIAMEGCIVHWMKAINQKWCTGGGDQFEQLKRFFWGGWTYLIFVSIRNKVRGEIILETILTESFYCFPLLLIHV